jgi:hypothetical protein
VVSTPAAALAIFRLVLLAALPYEALIRYGDYEHFFNLADFARAGGGGLPFIDHWVEFPPLFPYFSLALYDLVGGAEHLYSYALAILMALCDVANVLLVARLARKAIPGPQADRATWLYAAFLALPAFGWWTFDPLAVLAMLITLDSVTTDRTVRAGLAAGMGILTKLVPGIALLVAWRFWPRRRALIATAVAAGVALAGLTPFLVRQPEMTMASLQSQAAKGSWQTVWAVLDGNTGTGMFGTLDERFDPSLATTPRGEPARIPHWIPTLLAGAVGFGVLLRTPGADRKRAAPLLGFLLFLLFLWSRGWSPQWLAFLAPVIAIGLPTEQAAAFGLNLVAVSLLEWPVLITRGRFDLLWIPVVIRTALFALLAAALARRAAAPADSPRGAA